MYPELPHPPQPVVTRWGTWLEAVAYYATNMQKFASVLEQLDEDEAASIASAKKLAASEEVQSHLAFIQTNYSHLVDAIAQLEARGMDMRAAIRVFDNAVNAVESVHTDLANCVSAKAADVRQKNGGLAHLRNISCVIFDGAILEDQVVIAEKYTAEQLSCFRWSPVTSCDVERSFSMLKALYRENRASFTDGNLGRQMIVHYNAQILQLVL